VIEANTDTTVEITEIDENTMFTGLSDGTLDAVLEIWPSGVVAEEQAYIDDGSVVNIGELGVIGKIGWFMPKYMVDEHPELATYEGFQDPALASLFATPDTCDKGRFLGGDSSWSQYDEQIITNLAMPMQVVFAGSEEAILADLDTKYENQEPTVFYFWTPHSAFAKYDLVNVTLPDYTADCYADPAAIDCDYPEDVLFKAAWSGLQEEAPDAYTILSNMKLTNDDQIEMLGAVAFEGKTLEQAASDWVAANQSVVDAWLP
jgi:glycine betaine/proline transport system substrate-binding protein